MSSKDQAIKLLGICRYVLTEERTMFSVARTLCPLVGNPRDPCKGCILYPKTEEQTGILSHLKEIDDAS